MSEADICAKYISPAIIQAGWDEATQIRREVYFTKGRIIVRGKLVTRGKGTPVFVPTDYARQNMIIAPTDFLLRTAQ